MAIGDFFSRLGGRSEEPAPEPEPQRPPTGDALRSALAQTERLVADGGVPSPVTARVLRVTGTVRDGLPAYLLLLDGLIEGDPGNAALLRAAAGMYGSYAGSFVAEPARAGILAQRARDVRKRYLRQNDGDRTYRNGRWFCADDHDRLAGHA